MEDQTNEDLFHALPYELAHAVVRSLRMHAHAFREAKTELQKLVETDPGKKKAKTIKANKKFEGLQNYNRYIVMNRRTGFVATKDWLAKYMVITESGKPVLKKEGSKASVWLLTLKIQMNGHNVKIELSPGEGKPFRQVRCFDLPNATYKTHLATITAGYEHAFGADGDQVWVGKEFGLRNCNQHVSYSFISFFMALKIVFDLSSNVSCHFSTRPTNMSPISRSGEQRNR